MAEQDSEPGKDESSSPAQSWNLGTRRSADPASHLFKVSKEAASYALEHSESSKAIEVLWSAIAVGVAAETLLKWKIARLNPLLLTHGANTPDGALFLAGVAVPQAARGKRVTRPSEISTISALPAWLLLNRIQKFTKVDESAVAQMLATRNAAVHMGLVESDDLRSSIRIFVALADELIARETSPDTVYFSVRFQKVLNANRQKTADVVAASFAAKSARAHAFYIETFGHLPPATRIPLLSHLEAKQESIDEPDVQLIECPVCLRSAVAFYEETFQDYDHGENGEISVTVIGKLDSVRCHVCGLDLNAQEARFVKGAEPSQDWGIQLMQMPDTDAWYDD